MAVSPKCRNGHVRTAANTRFYKVGLKGKTIQRWSCRLCESNRKRLKYKTDPEYKAKMKAYSRRQAVRNKEIRCQQNLGLSQMASSANAAI